MNATDPTPTPGRSSSARRSGLDEFDALFAAESHASGLQYAARDILPLLAGDWRPSMVAALKAVKARFKTGCITE